MSTACTVWTAFVPCKEAYQGCYPNENGTYFSFYGTCQCSAFFGYHARADDAVAEGQGKLTSATGGVWKDHCKAAPAETVITLVVLTACICVYLADLRVNLKTLAFLREMKKVQQQTMLAKISAPALPIKHSVTVVTGRLNLSTSVTSSMSEHGGSKSLSMPNGSRNNNASHTQHRDMASLIRYAITLLNINGSVMSLLAAVCNVITVTGHDRSFSFHNIFRPLAQTAYGSSILLVDLMIFFTWKEIYMRSGKVSKQALKMPQIPMWLKIVAAGITNTIAVGFLVAQAYGESMIATVITIASMAGTASIMIPAGKFVALQLHNSSSASIIYVGNRVRELSRSVAMFHGIMCLLLTVSMLIRTVPSSGVLPLICTVVSEAQVGLSRAAIGKYIQQVYHAIVSSRGFNNGEGAAGLTSGSVGMSIRTSMPIAISQQAGKVQQVSMGDAISSTATRT